MTVAATARPGGAFLQTMARASRVRVRAAREREPEPALRRRALATPPPPALRLSGFDVIAELKLRSPAGGDLAAADFDRTAQIDAYAAGGAAAVSVLTEPEAFKGRLGDLAAAAAVLAGHGIPAMRKDFLTDPYQVLEARAAGAGGVLVIVTMLADGDVLALLDSAAEHGLFVLLEGFDERDLERIAALDVADRYPVPVLCGVNCRDLASLEVDFERFGKLAARLPPRLPAVAESGMDAPADVRTVARLGYRAALIGSALMRSADAARRLSELRQAGAQAAGVAPCS